MAFQELALDAPLDAAPAAAQKVITPKFKELPADVQLDPTPPGPNTIKMPGSVMDGFTPPEPTAPLIESRGAPVSDDTYKQIRSQYDNASIAQRRRLVARDDAVGSVAKTIQAEYGQQDAMAAGMPTMQNASMRVEDRRRAAQATLAQQAEDNRPTWTRENVAKAANRFGNDVADAGTNLDAAVGQGVYEVGKTAALLGAVTAPMGATGGSEAAGADQAMDDQFRNVVQPLDDMIEHFKAKRTNTTAGQIGGTIGDLAVMWGEISAGGGGANAATQHIWDIAKFAYGIGMRREAAIALAKGAQQTLGDAVVDMAPAYIPAAVQHYKELTDQGVDPAHAAAATFASAAGTAALGAVPLFKAGNVATRVASGAVANPALTAGTTAAENAALSDYPNQQRDPLDPGSMLSSAVIGGGFAGAFGHQARPELKAVPLDGEPPAQPGNAGILPRQPSGGAVPPNGGAPDGPSPVEQAHADLRAHLDGTPPVPQAPPESTATAAPPTATAVPAAPIQPPQQAIVPPAMPSAPPPVAAPPVALPAPDEASPGDGTRAAPVKVTDGGHVALAEQNVDTAPTDGQKAAGNYKMGHLKWNGLDVTVENPFGSTRSGTDANGQPWETVMPATYGYIKGSEGADGDHVDVYLGHDANSKDVYVVDQIDPATRRFDEHKALMGFSNADEAMATYANGFSDGSGPQRVGAVTPMSMDEFKAWIKTGNTRKALKYKNPPKAPAAPAVEAPKLTELPLDAPLDQTPPAATETAVKSGEPQPVQSEPAHTQQSAEAIARQLSKGQPPELQYRAVPHPTEAGKFAVVQGQQEAAPAPVKESLTTPAAKPNTNSSSWVIRNKETGEVILETFDRKKVDALNTQKYEAVPIQEYLASLNTKKPAEPEPPSKNLDKKRRARPKSDSLVQAIINRGGISTSLRSEFDKDARTQPGLFTKDGHSDLSALAEYLANEDGFSQIDLNADDDTGGSRQLVDLVIRAIGGERVLNAEAMVREKNADVEKQRQSGVLQQADQLGIKTKFRPFTEIEQEVAAKIDANIKAEEDRLDEEAASLYGDIYGEALNQVGEDALQPMLNQLADAHPNIREFYNAAAKAIKEKLNEIQPISAGADGEANADQARQAGGPVEPQTGNQRGQPADQGAEGQARELTLEGQTPAELRAANDAENQRIREEQDAATAERQAAIDKEVADRQGVAADNFSLEPQLNDKNKQRQITKAKIDSQLAGQGDVFDQPAAKPDAQPDAEKAAREQADKDLEDALGDLGDILGKNARANFTPEQEKEIIPILVRLFDAAFRKGYYAFKDAARFVLDAIKAKFGNEVADQITIDHLQGGYISMAARYKEQGADRPAVVAAVESKDELPAKPRVQQPKETENVDVQRGSTDLERDRQDANPENAVGQEDVSAGRIADGDGGGSGILRDEIEGWAGGGVSLPGHEAATAGERGHIEIYTGSPIVTPGTAGNSVSTGSGDGDLFGPPIESDSAGAVDKVAQSSEQLAEIRTTQHEADKVPLGQGLKNIKDTLPTLKEGQQEDVFKAETRFHKTDGYGMLFTNGTGTGKTFTGLGIVKRMVRAGKGNVIIAVPNDKIADDWTQSGKLLGIDINRLPDTNSAGKGVVITTYANFGQNPALAKRDWHLVVTDEAHYLAMNKDGKPSLALKALQAITLHPDGTRTRSEMLHSDLHQKLKELDAQAKSERMSDDERQWRAAVETERKADAVRADLKEKEQAIKKHIADNQGEKRPRSLFLSATPFAYEKATDWGNGFLFDYGPDNTNGGYNSAGPRESFMQQHFGWRMRYNKLTEPDAKVDRGLMQRQFNSWLKREGALSGRMLDVQHDYDRKFVLVDSAIGRRIDDALEWFEAQRKDHVSTLSEGNYSDPRVKALDSVAKKISEKFDYLSRRYLLEAIKAQEVVPIVKAHLALGRKVVVFHDYKKGGGFHPFDIREISPSDGGSDNDKAHADAYNQIVGEFRKEFDDVIGSDIWNSSSPIVTFQREFPNAKLFNGDIPAAQRRANVESFQSDDSGPQVILVQSAAGREGISLHDTTGKHQRVLINLGQPTQPATSIQQEGRIYRVGQASNAIFRYLNTGTNWEKWAFATTIAQRASAVENLGMGEQARALKDAFISGFEESGDYPAGHEDEGTGGKARDKAANDALTEYDRAKAFYYGTAKKNSKTKAQEGKDYFATPEPIGLKMVEWADIRPGERFLEPSAGHGAIARWAPETADRTAIEPSMALRPRLAMVFDGKIIDSDFENLHIVNKYDAIVMNPPFGTGGKMAVDHLIKAISHLNDGGRVVALIPNGPAADKRFQKWFYEPEERQTKPIYTHPTLGPIHEGDTLVMGTIGGGELKIGGPLAIDKSGPAAYARPKGESKSSAVNLVALKKIIPGSRTEEHLASEGLHFVADIMLPNVAFERAGTSVGTRVVVIEKSDAAPGTTKNDYRDITDINELFTRLEHFPVPARAKPVEEENPAAALMSRGRGGKLPNAKPEVDKAAAADAAKAMGLDIIEHTTGKGKVLRGVVRTDLTKDQAKEIDAFTFKKDGGWFIREKHLAEKHSVADGDKFSAAYKAKEDEIVAGIVAIAKKIAPQINVHAVERIFFTKADGSKGESAGRHIAAKNLIEIALAHDNQLGTLRHEVVHALKSMGLFTDAEWKILQTKAGAWRKQFNVEKRWDFLKEQYKDDPEGLQEALDEEAISDAFKAYGRGEDNGGGLLPRIFAKIKQFFERLRNFFNGLDFKTTDDVFSKVESGEVGRRNTEEPDTGAAEKYSTIENSEPDSISKPSLPAETKPQKFQRVVQDQMNRFRVLNDVMNEAGIPVSEAADVYKAETLMHGRIAARVEDFREKVLHQLIDKIQTAGFTMQEIADYLEAQHTPEANAAIRKLRNDETATAAGLTDEEAEDYMRGQPKDLADLANEFRKITDATRNRLLNGGIISKEMSKAWTSAYEHYVPLRGGDGVKQIKQGTGPGLSVSGKQRRRLGHSDRDEYIIENIILAAERSIHLVEKNIVGHHLLRLVTELADPDIATVGEPEKRQVLKEGKKSYTVEIHGSIMESFDNINDARQFVKFMGRSDAEVVTHYADPTVQYMAQPQLQENEAMVYVDGKAVRVQFHDELLARAYKRLGAEGLPKILEAGRSINTWLSKAYTGYNPEFILKNMVRDATAGLFNITADYGPAITAKAVKNYPAAVRDILVYSMTGKESDIVSQYRAEGGSTGAGWLSDIDRIGRSVQKAYDDYVGVIGTAKSGRKLAAAKVAGDKVVGKAIGWIEHLNAASENGMRLAVFEALLDAGHTPKEAARAAKESTVNFNRKGEIGPSMGALYLFYNPAVQSVQRLIQSLTKSPHKGKAMAIVGAIAALSYLVAKMSFGDDHDEWEKISQYEKDHNLIIRTGESSYVKIPLPYELAFFFSVGNLMYQLEHTAAQGAAAFKKAGVHLASSFFESYSPVGNPVEGGAIAVLPTVPQYVVEAGTNQTAQGRPIVPESPFDKNKPDFLKMNRNTKGSAYAKLSDLLNRGTGGSKTQEGAISVSPEMIKFWTRNVAGGAGAFAADMLQLGNLGVRWADATGAEADALKPELREIPVVRTFMGEETIRNTRQVFWEKAKEAEKAADDYARARKGHDEVDKTELVKLGAAVQGFAHAAALKRNAIDKIIEDENLSLGQKRIQVKQLEAAEQKIYDKFLMRYSDRVEGHKQGGSQ